MFKDNNKLKISDIEKDLMNVINKYGISNKLSVDKIRKIIFKDNKLSAKEAFNKFEIKVLRFFPIIEDIDELNLIFQTLNNAWNYFPHAALGGKSPYEMMDNNVDKNIINKKMPNVIVGGHEMSWEKYEIMIKEMEKLQKPFKNWIDNLLQEYKKYLEKDLSIKIAEKHYQIADLFFERVLYVGFINFDDIRLDFIHKDFPDWWKTHVIFGNYNKKTIVSSLYKLFSFIQLVTLRDIKKFGF
jgi:hypothetical protein